MDAEQIAYALDARARPNGGGWLCRCPCHQDRRPSLSIAEGSNGRVLWRCHAGCSQEALLAELQQRGLLDKPNGPDRTTSRPRQRTDDWRALMPVPEDAPAAGFQHAKYGRPAATWRYRDAAGRTLFYVARLDLADGDKAILPRCYGILDGHTGWRWRAPAPPRPLYRLDLLAKYPAAPVLVCEGEKAADAARKRELVPEYIVVTWQGGCEAVAKADWSALKGRDVVIWPDHDTPGLKAAHAIAELLQGVAAEVRIVELPDALPSGWDLGDSIPDDLDVEALIEAAPAYEPESDEDENTGASSEPKEARWPDPLDQVAFHGLAGDVVRAIEPHSEADTVALLLQFLSAFGNACGRTHYVYVESDKHPPQLWALLAGLTSKARKGTSWGRILALFRDAVPDWAQDHVKAGLSSGEGLIWQVRDPIVQRVKDKRTGEYEEEQTDAGVDDKRLLVTETEFASVLRHMERQGNTLSTTMRQFWDRGDVQSLTKNSPARTTGAAVSIIGHVTVDELRRYLTRTEMANGLANRFLFACVKRSKFLPFGGDVADLSRLAKRVGGRLSTVAKRGHCKVNLTEGAKAIWREVYRDLSEGRPGLVGAAVSRAEAQVLRIALVYALLDGDERIAPEHLKAALAVWRYCDESASYLFGMALGDPVADEILRALKANPEGPSRTSIYHLFRGHQSSGAMGAALAALQARGLVSVESKETGGRPEERWLVR